MKKIACLIIVILSLAAGTINAQKNETSIVRSLGVSARPVKTLNAAESFADIDFLKVSLADKEIVALGEVTHGTAEVFRYKDRLVRFLISNLNFRSIGFESDYAAVAKIDDYINGVADTLIFLPGSALMSTNRQMIDWLRRYNGTRPEADRVHVYGLEARGYSGIITKLLTEEPGLESADRERLREIAGKPYERIDKADRSDLLNLAVRLRRTNLSEIRAHYVQMLEQIAKYPAEGRGFRDAYMARNAEWLKHRAENGKLIIWAHNGHVAKMKLYGYPTLGTHLHERHGSRYGVIATDFNHGKAYVNVWIAKNKPLLGFQAHYYPEVKSPKGYEYYFSKSRYSNFILDLREDDHDADLAAFLKSPREMRLIGAWSVPSAKKLSLSDNFDILVYFNETTSQW
ncbi:erythromycin esterase family protein [Pedobacter sp. SYP-B3415]|uniref:erythromycin esterase family protein n=1 Tax=Pedobacter sp. SYP-B3415 TaxID=2496641 RepID=UPI0013EA36B8|nr:erythromycin esterase family protein [Pedobacter sp. SYP-B3415]